MHYLVALVLLGVAGFVLADTVDDLFTTRDDYATATTAVNGVLFSIIILEVMDSAGALRSRWPATPAVPDHRDDQRRPRDPFRRAELLLNGGNFSTAEVHLSLVELGVNAAVVVGLAFAIVLIRRFADLQEGDDYSPRPRGR